MKKINRRDFIKTTAQVSAGVVLTSSLAKAANWTSEKSAAFSFKQIPLPYEFDGLKPSIDIATMRLHYEKHHAAYVKNINEAIAAEKISVKDELDFFKKINLFSDKARNNGGGAWNHNFFWQVMAPGGAPLPGKVANAIDGAFGSFEKFTEQFTDVAMKCFGSGWAWLIATKKNQLRIISTPNQNNPLMATAEAQGVPLLGIDVWEHAYYLKYQNKRADYIANWWKVVNWNFVASRL